jgi:hypothetical protein
LDLFSIERSKRIWDLKINNLNRNYDVVGVFNFDYGSPVPVYVNWKDLGIQGNTLVHVFDFWNKEYIGAFEKGIAVELPQTSCRVLTLVPATDKIQLVSTSRHITQGWLDLVNLSYDDKKMTYSGTSRIIKNDPYELRFAFPKGTNYKIKSVSAKTSLGSMPAKIYNHQGWSVVEFTSGTSTDVKWDIVFELSQLYKIPTEEPTQLWTEIDGFDGVNIRWVHRLQTSIGYQVYLNGELLGFTPNTVFPLRNLNSDQEYTVEVRTVGQDFSVGEKKASLKFSLKPMIPQQMYLSDLVPEREGKGWRLPEKNLTILGKGMKMGGKSYAYGLGIPSNSEMEYNLKGQFTTFTALVGIDDENKKENEAEFIVLGDSKELWRSGMITNQIPPKQVNVDIKNVKKIVLKVVRGTNGASGDQTNWADPVVIR